jgi:hypothetical protein
VVGVVAVLVGCSSGAATGVTASMRSNARPASTVAAPTTTEPARGSGSGPAATAFCVDLSRFGTDPAATGDDPAAVVGALAKVAGGAPPELRADFATITSVAGELSGLDGSDPASVGRALDIVLRPDVVAAADAIEAYAQHVCGLDLRQGGPGGTGLSDRVEMSDVKAVQDAAGPGSWADEVQSIDIANGTVLDVASGEHGALTAEQAMTACMALRAALLPENPDLSITVSRGSTALVRATTGSECAPA